LFYYSDGTFRFPSPAGVALSQIPPIGTGPGTGTWFHIASTYNSATGQACIIYDGTNAQCQTLGGLMPASADLVLLGDSPGPADLAYGGIDNLMIWNVASSQTDICASAGAFAC